MCYTVGYCCFSILLIVVCICSSQTPDLSLPHSPFADHKFVFNVYESTCFINKFTCIIFLDSTCKRYHDICLCLTCFT